MQCTSFFLNHTLRIISSRFALLASSKIAKFSSSPVCISVKILSISDFTSSSAATVFDAFVITIESIMLVGVAESRVALENPPAFSFDSFVSVACINATASKWGAWLVFANIRSCLTASIHSGAPPIASTNCVSKDFVRADVRSAGVSV